MEQAFHCLQSPTLAGLVPLDSLRSISDVAEIDQPDGFGFVIRLDPYRKPLLVGGFAHRPDAESELRRLREALAAPDLTLAYNPFEDLTLRTALWGALQFALSQAETSLKIRYVAPAGSVFRVLDEEPEAGFYAAVNPEGDVLVSSGRATYVEPVLSEARAATPAYR